MVLPGRFRALQGIQGLSRTGGFGRFRCQWVKVVDTGVWLDESGVLGASPDGLVGEDHVLEAKCSYTFRNASTRKL